VAGEQKIKSGKSRAGPAPKPGGKASHQKENGNCGHNQREIEKQQEKRRGKRMGDEEGRRSGRHRGVRKSQIS
jgi:hypothetical protein